MSTTNILLITLSILIVVSIGITLYIYFTMEDPPELELDEDLFIQNIVDKLEENNKQDEAMAQKVANILNVDKNKQDEVLARKVASLVTKDNKDSIFQIKKVRKGYQKATPQKFRKRA